MFVIAHIFDITHSMQQLQRHIINIIDIMPGYSLVINNIQCHTDTVMGQNPLCHKMHHGLWLVLTDSDHMT